MYNIKVFPWTISFCYETENVLAEMQFPCNMKLLSEAKDTLLTD